MSLLDIILLSISLGIDCFTVSVVCGAIERRWLWSVAMRSSVLFGLFQALMPLAGWLALHFYAARLEQHSPLLRLSGGYGYVSDAAGRAVLSAGQVREGDLLTIRFKDGRIAAAAERVELIQQGAGRDDCGKNE